MRLLGSFYLLLAASIWGGMYVISRAVMEFIPPYSLLEMRMAISTLTLGAIALYSKKARVAWGDLPFLCLVGIIGCTISIGTQFMGTHLSSASAGGALIVVAVMIASLNATPERQPQ